MHEFTMVSHIVQSVLAEADKNNAKKILEVHLIIGNLTFLGIDQVNFSYRVLTKNTKMQGSKLKIETRDGIVECNSCGYRGTICYENDSIYHLSFPTLNCPKCGCVVKIVEGQECIIKNIKAVV